MSETHVGCGNSICKPKLKAQLTMSKIQLHSTNTRSGTIWHVVWIFEPLLVTKELCSATNGWIVLFRTLVRSSLRGFPVVASWVVPTRGSLYPIPCAWSEVLIESLTIKKLLLTIKRGIGIGRSLSRWLAKAPLARCRYGWLNKWVFPWCVQWSLLVSCVWTLRTLVFNGLEFDYDNVLTRRAARRAEAGWKEYS
jgi:hypothetical protein